MFPDVHFKPSLFLNLKSDNDGLSSFIKDSVRKVNCYQKNSQMVICFSVEQRPHHRKLELLTEKDFFSYRIKVVNKCRQCCLVNPGHLGTVNTKDRKTAFSEGI